MNQTDALLRYRAWKGKPRGPLFASVAMARAALALLARKRLVWGLAALGLLVFFTFFYAQYLAVYVTTVLETDTVRFAGVPVSARNLTRVLDRLALNGTAHTFGNFVWWQGYVLVIVLALAGSLLVGNDFAHGSLPFYLSKPIGRAHYVLGKCLAVGALVNLFTTVPAVALWVEAGLLYDWQTYYLDNLRLLFGIVGYGLVLTVVLSLLLVATAVWVRRTVPLAMLWMGLFALLPMLSGWLVDATQDEHWRLIDVWNNLYLCGLHCLGAEPDTIRPQPQPAYGWAWLACAAVAALAALYLRKRVQAVEIVT
jgi:ABC-type transport system involved in multi-copper enzyme maturation permease subunit